ncbi:MAG: hypothetical protein HYX78_07515 [Armatimonadetes bacterium]|nr:hypothetical protein [Armatimonadota bacterium]
MMNPGHDWPVYAYHIRVPLKWENMPRDRRATRDLVQFLMAPAIHERGTIWVISAPEAAISDPDDELRRWLVPLAQRYPLNDLIAACRAYAEATGRRVTYEYLLLAGVNDSPAHARKLAGLIKGSLANVNLIPYNTVFGKDYKRPQAGAVKAFRSVLQDAGIEITERFERGHAVSAACGQLSAGAGSGVG